MNLNNRTLSLGLGVAFAGILQTRAAAARFETPALNSGTVTLRLLGDTGKTYRIEASSNLLTWAEISTGIAQNGMLTVVHGGPAQQPRLYYRGREIPATPPYPTVVPQLSSNYVATSLITPELGGLLQILTPEGLAISLDIPTNAVFSPVLARMTLVTNLTGVPAVAGFLGAVQLEPAGLLLASPTFLRVSYPTNIPNPQIASYTFDRDGRNLHLTPDLVGTNSVRIVVSQFRGYGSGKFTLAELQALLATGPARLAAPARRGGVRLHATLEECYPDEEAEAKALHEELTEAMRPIQEEIAGELAIERQKQLLGVSDEEPGSSAVQEAVAKGANWYGQNILPRMANAEQKCLVATELLYWILGWERQLQLLGAASDDDPGASAGFLCKAMVRCQDQIVECCKTRGADRRLAIQLLGLERQRQLLGMTEGQCGAWNDAELDACLPQWYGELRITDQYKTNYVFRSDGAVVRGSEVRTFEFAAYVDNAEEVIVEPFPLFEIPGSTNITVKLSGLAQGAHTITRFEEELPICPGGRAVALAGIGPHDAVPGYRSSIQMTSSISNVVNVEVRVTLTDDSSGGIFAPKTGLTFLADIVEVPWKGMNTRTDADYFGGSCEEKTEQTPPEGKDNYSGVYVDAKAGQFHHAEKEISYSKVITERDLTREIVLKLKRKN